MDPSGKIWKFFQDLLDQAEKKMKKATLPHQSLDAAEKIELASNQLKRLDQAKFERMRLFKLWKMAKERLEKARNAEDKDFWEEAARKAFDDYDVVRKPFSRRLIMKFRRAPRRRIRSARITIRQDLNTYHRVPRIKGAKNQ